MLRVADNVWFDHEEIQSLTRWFGPLEDVRTIQDLTAYFARHRQRIATMRRDYLDEIPYLRELIIDSLNACERELLEHGCIEVLRQKP